MQNARISGSIGFRLSIAIFAAVFIGITISVSFFLISDFRRTVDAERERLRSSATAFAAAISESVSNGDRRGALEILRGIRNLSHVRFAEARNVAGEVLAEIGSGEILVGRDGAIEAQGALSTLLADSLTVATEIRHGGTIVGAIQLQAEISWLRGRYLKNFSVALVFGTILMVVTALIARMQIARIIGPLKALANEFGDIGKNSDLTKRLKHDRNDEVGVLVDAFNDMFSRIDERDRLLKEHRDSLEETIQIRTAEMRAARDEAEHANAAKSDFLATMSHEIRTPLNGMMVMAEMLSAASLPEKQLRHAEIITRSGRGLLNIINDILDFSKIEAGRLELEAVPFSIDTLVEDVASLFSEQARAKRLSIAIYVSPDVPARLIGDPTRINQVLTNLVNNGLKFTESGGLTIEVTSVPITSSCAQITVHVRDTGIGIPAEKIEHIFERFAQADQTITRKFGGTGLGLSITRKLIEAMGGAIAVKSALDCGSDFCFSLQLDMAAAAESVAMTGVPVLVLDDNPITASAAEKALAARGAVLVHGLDDTAPQIVLARADCLASFGKQQWAPSTPLVLMRSFLSATSPTAGIDISGEIQLPMRRQELDVLAHCAVSGDLTTMNEVVATSRRQIELIDHSGLRVLAVDDTAVNREVLKEALNNFRIRPDIVESGEEAIERVRAKVYDVIFMDCSMPGIDGFAATAEIRKLEAACGREPSKIIALTAHVTGAEATRWKIAGMDAYITKPFTIRQLAAVLSTEITHGSQRDEHPTAALTGATGTPGSSEWENVPLLAQETLDMFSAISVTNRSSVAERVFALFEEHARQGLYDLRGNLDGDPVEVAKLAHALKSMCSSAGARRAAEICEFIEHTVKCAKPIQSKLIDILEVTLDNTIGATTQINRSAKQATKAHSQYD